MVPTVEGEGTLCFAKFVSLEGKIKSYKGALYFKPFSFHCFAVVIMPGSATVRLCVLSAVLDSVSGMSMIEGKG